MTLDDRLRRVEEGLVLLKAQMTAFAEDHREILVILQGPPRSESIRGRLHKLEGDSAAASAAASALDAARLINDQARERRFTRREKLAGLAVAVLLALPAYIDLIHHFN